MQGAPTTILAVRIDMISNRTTSANVRPAAVAGSWYPNDPHRLTNYLTNLLTTVPTVTTPGPIRALISPHAGYTYSGITAGAVYKNLRGLTFKRVIILGPAHYGRFNGLSIGPYSAFATPLGLIPVDQPAVTELYRSPIVNADPKVHIQEHCIEMQLPFLQITLTPGWQLLPILVGYLQHDDAKMIAELLQPLADTSTLIVVSSDFTHYGPRFGYLPFAADSKIAERLKKLDDGLIQALIANNIKQFEFYSESTKITACGINPMAILLHLLQSNTQGTLHKYTTSGELTKEYTNSVSYASISFH